MSQGSDRSAYYDLTALTALVVDDNLHVLELVGGILESFGIKAVHKAASVDSALTKLDETGVDLIITDWAMEPVDGIELVRRIRGDGAICDPTVPIIMVTGHSEMDRVVEAREAGVTEFLAKPITPKAIYDCIVSVIENAAVVTPAEEPVEPESGRQEGVSPDRGDKASRERADKASRGENRLSLPPQLRRGLEKCREVVRWTPTAPKRVAIAVSVLWLLGAGSYLFASADLPDTPASKLVPQQANDCKRGSFAQRYECISQRRVTAQQQAFGIWMAKLGFVCLPPLVVMGIYKSMAQRSRRGKKKESRNKGAERAG